MIRAAGRSDVEHFPGIERAAGAAFRTVGMDAVADDDPLPPETLEHYRRSGRAWVAVDGADRTVGYLLLDLLDGAGHVEQVTVHPDARGQRLGAALLDAAQDWSARHASGALTLTTFADVPWNAPYYRRLGFAEVEADARTPGLQAVVDHEAVLGLARWARVAMRREGPSDASSHLHLRAATPDDVDEVLALWRCAAENDDRPADDAEHVQRLVARDPEALVLAVDGGAIVGSLIAGWDGWRCHLYRLAVAPSHRRHRVASALLAHAETRFVDLGGARADAMVLEDNGNGHGLWQAAGYARQERWRRWTKGLRDGPERSS